MKFQLGLDVIRSYKRLAYTPWHAIAEFVDNSTQSFSDHRNELDAAWSRSGERATLEVAVVYDKDKDTLRVSDNAFGMDQDALERALQVGARPENTDGRSEFGMGLKTAAAWFGNEWEIRTTRLGDPTEYTVTVDVERIAAGDDDIPYKTQSVDPSKHHTIVTITRLNRKLEGRTRGKIKDFLSSMYRVDLRSGALDLSWHGQKLEWDEHGKYLTSKDGKAYKKDFSFEVESRRVWGWVAILDKGGRPHAGFSMIRRGRVIHGWPDSWRPQAIFGQIQGSNDLVNQRIVGEINLDDFEVSHTKDDIQWVGDEEDQVQEKLKDVCADYVAVAKARRKQGEDERGPTFHETQVALQEFQAELDSTELADLIQLEDVPLPNVLRMAKKPVMDSVRDQKETFGGSLGNLRIHGFLAQDLSSNDPYVTIDCPEVNNLTVVVNMAHPYISQLAGSDGFLNYLRECAYDALAEWKATQQSAALDPDTVKMFKDHLFRLPGRIEMHTAAVDEPA